MSTQPTMFTTVMLDVPRRIRFRPGIYNYRMATVKKALPIDGLNKPKTFLATLCQWLWACLDEDHPFESPEDLAEIVSAKKKEEITTLADTLIECVAMYKAPADEKNGDGSAS